MPNQSVKIVFDSEPRRVLSSFFDFTNFQHFCFQVKTLFQREFPGMENGVNYVLKYIDDEGDCITVKSDEELQTSVKSQSGENLLKYRIVEERKAPPANKPSPQAMPDSREINRIAIEFITQGNLDRAREVLHKGLNKYPTQTTLYYNLACVESLAGDLEGSFESLRSALQFGYRNFEFIMKDADLANLRASTLYNVRSLLSQSGANLDALPSEEPAGAPPVEVAQELEHCQAPPPTVQDEIEEIVSDSSSDSDSEEAERNIPPPQVPVAAPPAADVPVLAEVSTPAALAPPAEATQSELESARFPYMTQLGSLEEMGFQTGKAMQALLKAKGNVAAALEALF